MGQSFLNKEMFTYLFNILDKQVQKKHLCGMLTIFDMVSIEGGGTFVLKEC